MDLFSLSSSFCMFLIAWKFSGYHRVFISRVHVMKPISLLFAQSSSFWPSWWLDVRMSLYCCSYAWTYSLYYEFLVTHSVDKNVLLVMTKKCLVKDFFCALHLLQLYYVLGGGILGPEQVAGRQSHVLKSSACLRNIQCKLFIRRSNSNGSAILS